MLRLPPFRLRVPKTIAEAAEILAGEGPKARLVAGGTDLLPNLKRRHQEAETLVSLNRIPDLRGIRAADDDNIVIGATTTLAEITRSDRLREQQQALWRAVMSISSPVLRSTGTIGGNLSQDVRCWYYRRGLSCYRAGGNLCYADTPEGMNREHALFEGSRCVAAGASDTAPAIVALDATMVIQNSGGERTVSAEDYFVGPALDIENTTVLRPGDILLAKKSFL